MAKKLRHYRGLAPSGSRQLLMKESDRDECSTIEIGREKS